MIILTIAIVLLAGSLGLMTAAVISNQIDPTYSSALAIPIANLASLALALLALPVAGIAYRRDKQATSAKRTLIAAAALVVALAALFPLSELGYLGKGR